jgi:iodothyronine deiodinase-like protein
VVYILEAHASDSWRLSKNVSVATPRNFDERDNVASSCVRKLCIEIPALVDTFDNAAETAYTGWPDRLYLVNREGRIAYKSGPGPFGFYPSELADALKRVAPAVKISPR